MMSDYFECAQDKYWYSAEGQPSNAVMAVLGIFGNERMKIIKVTI